MADSVVRNATKEDDTFIFDGTSSAGDEYLMENQDPELGEDPNDILDRLLQNPNQSFIESMPGTGELNFGPYDAQREVRDRFVTYEGLADPALSEYNITQMNYRKPGVALNQYGDPNPDSDAIPLREGGLVNYGFPNPFGGSMNTSGGAGGVLENIQEQVSNNGDVLRSMQGGMNGSPFSPIMERPGPTVPEGIFQNTIQGMPGENLTYIDKQINEDPRFPKPEPPQQNPGMDYSNFEPQIANLMQDPFSGMTFEHATMRQQQRDIKDPVEAKAIADAIARGSTGTFGNSLGLPQLFEEGGVAGLMMKKNENMEMPVDRSKLVLNRILQQGGKPQSNDPRLMAQLNTILGRKST